MAEKLCKNLDVELVAGSVLASGDFSQGIVGDTERLINEIARRARKVPWQLCALVVDEIEALAPSRDSDSKAGDRLSVLLAIITGDTVLLRMD
jgi:SpoVK/Ycf46/Vps4 family AAA+-type ATPase